MPVTVKLIPCLLLFLLASCVSKHPAVNKNLLKGYWVSIEPQSTPGMLIGENNFSLQLDDASINETETFDLNYSLKGRHLFIHLGSYLVSKNKIVLLTNDSLQYVSNENKQLFRFVRKN